MWRGDIDWAQVAGNTTGPDRVVFTTLKASGADSHGGVPAHWAREAPEMAASGIPLVGGCHRLRTGDAVAQVDEFMDAMAAGLGGYEGRLVQLDTEAADAATVRAWMAEWNTRTNAYPVLGYLPDWAEEKWPASDLAAYDFAAWWASEYVAGSGSILDQWAKVTETQWHAWDGVAPGILQFTSQGAVPGVDGPCDVNVFRGTLAELRSIATR